MSKGNLSRTEYQCAPRMGYSEYGISRERYIELRNGCAEGKYNPKTLREACRGLEFIKPWIILSVTKSLSYDGLQRLWDLEEIERMACGRSDFYGFRRKFYHNLDCLLRSEQENVPVKESATEPISRTTGKLQEYHSFP